MSKPRRIWIEFAQPTSDEEAERDCALANNMLQRLGNVPLENTFGWDREEHQFYYGGPMGFLWLPDRGHWFNLEYIGRPLDPKEKKA